MNLADSPNDSTIAAMLPTRTSESNKGSAGRLLVVGGSRDFVGAPALSSLAAYRAGAGLVELAVPQSVQSMISSHAIETIFCPLPDDGRSLVGTAVPPIRGALHKARALVFGPGMSLTAGTEQVTSGILTVLPQVDINGVVIDADGLNALARMKTWWPTRFPLIITPHPGEMSRLTGLTIAQVQSDRAEVAHTHALRWGVIVVLKGSGTVVADSDGRVSVNPTGGPNLATAGTGDVLSGIVGGLLAQGCTPWEAAVVGVYLHGRAGDLVRAELGDIGTLARDLLDAIPRARLSILNRDEDKV